MDQQRRQLAVRFYSKCYCTMSEVDMLARRFRLVSNRYIVCKSANVKECQYQVMISYGLFEETNEQRIFLKHFKINKLNSLYIIFNEKSFWWTEQCDKEHVNNTFDNKYWPLQGLRYIMFDFVSLENKNRITCNYIFI